MSKDEKKEEGGLLGGAMGDVDKLKEDLLGADYDYGAPIKNPREMGMSSRGTIETLGKDIGGLLGYMTLMVQGGGRASKVNGPLGDKYFMPTAAQCTDVATKQAQVRSIYINNIPDGSVPFMPQGMGDAPFSDFRGLMPGIITNVSNVNPFQILQAFMTEPSPDCRLITLEQVKQVKRNGRDKVNESTMKSAYVTDKDIERLGPCLFPNGNNPVTGENCDGFTTLDGDNGKQTHRSAHTAGSRRSVHTAGSRRSAHAQSAQMPSGWLIRLYFSSLGLLGLYIFLKLLCRKTA
jgi:hypothetical protein